MIPLVVKQLFIHYFCKLSPALLDLGLAEIHLWVLLLEFLEDIHLLLLVRGRQASLLLSLVKHHLLNHAPGLAVEIGELGVFGLDLGDVDGGCAGDDVCPPLHLVDLVEVDFYALGAVRVGGQGPSRVVDADRMGEIALLVTLRMSMCI